MYNNGTVAHTHTHTYVVIFDSYFNCTIYSYQTFTQWRSHKLCVAQGSRRGGGINGK